MTDETNEIGTDHRLSVSRRTVVKGAAWSVPAIMIATQAPAMAASPPVYIVPGESELCKIPGNSFDDSGYFKGYVFWAAFVNETGGSVWLRVNSITVGGIPRCLVGLTDPYGACPPTGTMCIEIPESTQDDPTIIGVFSNSSTDSSSTALQINFSWFSAPGCAVGDLLDTFDLSTLNGQLKGGPWTGTNGQGSCKFVKRPDVCSTPLSAAGTACEITTVGIESVEPNTGPAAGGQNVTIEGVNFTGVTDVTFGGTAAASYNVVDSTTITAVTPAHAPGTVDVTVMTTSGAGTLPGGYTFLA